MSPREKMLALIVAVGGILVLGFMGFTWSDNKLKSSQARISSFERELSDMDLVQTRLRQLQPMRDAVLEKSLANQPDVAVHEYKAWLLAVLKDVEPDLKIHTGRKVKNAKGEVVFETVKVQSSFTTSYLHLTQFLNEFYDADFVHRIVNLQLTKSANERGSRRSSGEQMLEIELFSEAICVPNGPDQPLVTRDRSPFYDQEIALERNKELLTRNLFGDGDDLPSIRVSGDGRYYLGQPISISLSGSDDDYMNDLAFEIDESTLPEELVGELEFDQGRNQFSIDGPALDEGRYSFDVIATDNGSPPEVVRERIAFNFEERRVTRQSPTRTREDPPFDIAKVTYVTAILRNRLGEPIVWIDCKQAGEIYKYTIGDSIDIGSIQGRIEAIDLQEVIIDANDGSRFRYVRGSVLAEPEVLSAISSVDRN